MSAVQLQTAQATLLLHRIAASAGDPLPPIRLLVVLAHPDDEVLALGARMERLHNSRLLTVTDGAPANGADAQHHGFSSLADYRVARRAESLAALAHAGVPASAAPEFMAQVPDQQASFHLGRLAQCIAEEIRDFAPEAILTHPYEGGHPDHDACAFAVHAAVQLVARDGLHIPTPIVEAPFYHAGQNGIMLTGVFLPYAETSCVSRTLSPVEQQKKRERLACFPSQAETLAQFAVDRESFRIAPTYNFMDPPHGSTLFYERFPWGMQGSQFRALAAAAIKDLFGTAPNHSGMAS